MSTNQQQPRPTVVAVLGCDDYGPCDPDFSAYCPHCGAGGRYIFTALMSDATTKRMMKGCLESFGRDVTAVQCEAALTKQKAAARGKGYVSKWDQKILDVLGDLRAGQSSIEVLRTVCRNVSLEKKAWMRQKGYIR